MNEEVSRCNMIDVPAPGTMPRIGETLAHAMIRDAIFSPDKSRRFVLIRDWSEGEPPRTLNRIGLNPSIAGAEVDDMTTRKDIGFAKRWGFNRVVMTNLIAIVSTDPWGLPYWNGIDNENLRHLIEQAHAADLVLAAWGSPPSVLANKIALAEHIYRLRQSLKREVYCIGRTRKGWPLHPSRTAYTDAPELFWEYKSKGEA